MKENLNGSVCKENTKSKMPHINAAIDFNNIFLIETYFGNAWIPD